MREKRIGKAEKVQRRGLFLWERRREGEKHALPVFFSPNFKDVLSHGLFFLSPCDTLTMVLLFFWRS